MPDWANFLLSKRDVITKEWPMLLLIAVLVSLAVWKLAQLYYRQEIKVLERTVSMLQVRPFEDIDGRTVEASKRPIDVERERTVREFTAGCSDKQRDLLRWMLKRDKATIADMPTLDGISEFLTRRRRLGIVASESKHITDSTDWRGYPALHSSYSINPTLSRYLKGFFIDPEVLGERLSASIFRFMAAMEFLSALVCLVRSISFPSASFNIRSQPVSLHSSIALCNMLV